MFSRFTAEDRKILREEAEKICPFEELEQALFRCMNERGPVSMLVSRVAPWTVCGEYMDKFAGCRVEKIKYLESNVDTVSRTMMFREALEDLSRAREKGRPTGREEDKIERIRADFKLILEAKKLTKAPPAAPPADKDKPDPVKEQMEFVKKMHEEEQARNEKKVRDWRAKTSHTDKPWLQFRRDDFSRWL
jgi:hypothetical protein